MGLQIAPLTLTALLPYTLNMSEETKIWLNQAEHDFFVAEENLKLKLFDVTCLYSQQTAEKALKAILINHNCDIPFTHSLLKIINLLNENGIKETEELKSEILDLEGVYPNIRYPGEIVLGKPPYKSITKGFAEKCLGQAKTVLNFAKNSLKD